MTRVFLDTNILCYPHDVRSPAKQSKAEAAIAGLLAPNYIPVISTQVLQEFYNTLTRKLGLTHAKARRELDVLARTETVQITSSLVLQAADLHDSDSVQFWDALVIAAATHADCDELWSEDFQTGRLFGKMKVVNPLI